MPLAGSTKPDAAMSMSLAFRVASNGVLAESCGLIGPALPETLAVPPPGRSTVSLKGNCEVCEKLVTSTFTLSYTCGFALELALPTASLPSVISNFPMERLLGAPSFAGSADSFALGPPRVEKFHVPFVALSK